MVSMRRVKAPTLTPMIVVRLILDGDVLSVDEGREMIFAASPVSNLAWDTEKLWYS